ncbi:phosphopantetheine adenylyltransferase, putative [Plasmodium relictum]|uniref:Phosphopantetheine adenylyltransferase, putative n=1 Tax=Plasmodium relictum TaxID=85471 RepID=A0A1J1H0R0_PLARL|nr:phosphopantetheine adenylyltransferase, putative [Plasmodium relictum]CRG98381.1 phosphopantetheine adenylyltransferase, putative [Plasmodium relictum]
MAKLLSYENAFLIFEDYNMVTYTRKRGRNIFLNEKKNLNNFNINNYLSKNLQKYNFSLARYNVSVKVNKENNFFVKLENSINWLIKYIIKLKKHVVNIYLFIKFISLKCILKMSTYYYLKYIVEKVYEHKLDKLVRVVLPIYDLHGLYSFIYYEKFCFMNYYKDILPKYDLNELKRYCCSFIISNNHNQNVTLPYRRIYDIDIIKMFKKKRKNKERRKEIKESNVKSDSVLKLEINNTKKKVQFFIKKKRILKRIKIQKYKIKRTINKNLKKNDIGLFAGTFDKIHFGHILLLFYSILLTKKFLYIGLYNNKNLCNKKYSEEIDDFNLRIYNISNILFLIRNVYHIHFYFKNFEHMNPFIKIKNSHKIIYEIITNETSELSVEYEKKKYQKYLNDFHSDKQNSIKKCNTLKKYFSLINNRIDLLYQSKFSDKKNSLLVNKIKSKISKYLYFHINSNKKNKKQNNRDQKIIIVLKKIHDPFSFAIDINDMFCLTISKESETNGYNIVNKRKWIFKKIKKKNNRIFMNYSNNDNDGNNEKYLSRNEKTRLNIFDTIDLGDGDKLNSTLIRKENSFLRKTKFAKILKYFIDACLFFDIEYFLIQMYINHFLYKKGKISFKKLYINKVKNYFCKNKYQKSEKSKKEEKNQKKKENKDKYIANDFFRHLFVLSSFFVNHYIDESRIHKIQLFMKISLSLSFFFYNNIILLVIRRREEFVNKSYIQKNDIEKKVSMFDNNNEHILRRYISDIDETFLVKILNQVLIFTILFLSISILCKIFHFDSLGKKKKKKEKQKQIEKEKENENEKLCNKKFIKTKELIKVTNLCGHDKYHINETEDKFFCNSKKPLLNETNKSYCQKIEEKKEYNNLNYQSFLNILNNSPNKWKCINFTNVIYKNKGKNEFFFLNRFSPLFFFNYVKSKRLYSHNYIVTPYIFCNYKLMSSLENSIFNYHNFRIYDRKKKHSSNYKYSNDITDMNDKEKFNNKDIQDKNDILNKNGAQNFNLLLTEKMKRNIINNFYEIKIKYKKNIFNSNNKITVSDIKNYVKGSKSNNYYKKRLETLIKININNDDEILFIRKILIYKFLDNYFISFFCFYFLNYLMNNKYEKSQSLYKTNLDDFLYIFLVHFEKQIEIFINSHIKKRWKLIKRKNDSFNLYNKYVTKFSIIHRFLITNISPLNNYNIDFEKKYYFKKKKNNFVNTPFHIKLENFNNLNVFSFYNIIFQNILKYENYYYPYFSSLNYFHLD